MGSKEEQEAHQKLLDGLKKMQQDIVNGAAQANKILEQYQPVKTCKTAFRGHLATIKLNKDGSITVELEDSTKSQELYQQLTDADQNSK